MTCQYGPQEGPKIKAWCRKMSADTCTGLVTQPRLWTVPGKPRYFIQDYPRLGYFTITMTKLRVEDSGFYWCGTFESYRISIFRTTHLVVSQGKCFSSFCMLLRFPGSHAGEDAKSFPPALSWLNTKPLAQGHQLLRAEPTRTAGFQPVLPSTAHTFL